MYEQIRVDPFNHPTSRFTRHRWAARDMRHGAQGRRVRTGEERGVGLGELVEVVVTQFVAEAPSTSMEICNRIPTPDTCCSFPAGREVVAAPSPRLVLLRLSEKSASVTWILCLRYLDPMTVVAREGVERGGAVVVQRGWGGGGAAAAWGGG